MPSALSDFETQARRLRYAALGRACIEADITRLFFAHHSDDQAETVLMRLAAGDSGKGLAGMRGHLPLSECWGMHGLHQSGHHENVITTLGNVRYTGKPVDNPRNEPRPRPYFDVSRRPIFEGGGVEVYRPLLNFSKETLREICKGNDVQWEEDESNHDITLTPRNTIRSLLQNNRLPKALRKDSLLQLAERSSLEAEEAMRAARALLQTFKIVSFDVRSGVIVVRLPTISFLSDNKTESYHHRVYTYCLHLLVQAVCPLQDPHPRKISSAARIVFASPEDSTWTDVSHSNGWATFPTCSTQLSRIRLKGQGKDMREQNETGSGNLDPDFCWMISRQPFDETPRAIIFPGVSQTRSLVDVLKADISLNDVGLHHHWSAWQLWDGRFWIRIRNRSSKTLVLRTWAGHELPAIRDSMDSPNFKIFQATLKAAAPGKIRWSLPVIAEAATEENSDNVLQGAMDMNPSNDNMTASDDSPRLPDSKVRNATLDKSGKILVFPTLGKVGWLDIRDEKGKQRFNWEVRYKHVDFLDKDPNDREEALRDFDFVKSWGNRGQGRATLFPGVKNPEG